MENATQHSKQGGVLTLSIRDKLDAAAAEHLDRDVRELIRGGEHCLALDLSAVAYLSSAGIRFLLTTYQALNKLGGSFAVVRPSPAVKSVLELSGMARLLQDEAAGASPPRPAAPAARAERKGAAAYTLYATAPGATLTCRVVGDPGRLAQASFDPRGGTLVTLDKDLLALGLGRFQQAGADERADYGEFLAVGGAGMCLPGDGANTPDYMLTSGALVPRVQALYALLARGRFAHCARFETGDGEGRESLSGLARAALELTGVPAVGLVLLAESAGLIGAALKRAPVGSAARTSLFAHPEIRDWLTFTPERVHDRSLVLAVGLAVSVPHESLAPLLRPLGAESWPAGHFHAAVFTPQPIPNGPLALEPVLDGLFEDSKLLAVMHLLNDHRDISGAGDSYFTRGVMWLGPVEEEMVDG